MDESDSCQKKRQSHPLLREGTKLSSSNGKSSEKGLSSSQINSLSAICETLIPPVPVQSLENEKLHSSSSSIERDALEGFASASGSGFPLPFEGWVHFEGGFYMMIAMDKIVENMNRGFQLKPITPHANASFGLGAWLCNLGGGQYWVART